jgi:hypothetical protein
MRGQRVKFVVEYEVDLDPVSGWGDNFNDWFKVATKNFADQGHYDTVVRLVGEPEFNPYMWVEDKGWTLMDEAGRLAVLKEMASPTDADQLSQWMDDGLDSHHEQWVDEQRDLALYEDEN